MVMCVIFVLYVGVLVAYYIIIYIYVIWCRDIMLFGVKIYLLCGVEILCYLL